MEDMELEDSSSSSDGEPEDYSRPSSTLGDGAIGRPSSSLDGGDYWRQPYTRPPPPPSSASACQSARKMTVKLPEFWQEEPEMWFETAEAQFHRGGVLDSRAKTDYLLVALPAAVLRSVRDILRDPSADDTTLYHRLKERLLRRYAPSKWQLVYQVLDHPGIGDQRPSQLLDSMLALLPAGEPPGLLFQGLFLRRLPSEIRDHVAAGDYRTVREMAAVADQLWDARREAPASISAVRGQSPSRRGKNRYSSPSGSRRDVTPGPDGLCYYHSRFKKRAHKCQPPCSWTENSTAAGGN